MSGSPSGNKIQFLHSLRGIAAVLVVIYHLGFLFWVAPISSMSPFLLPRTETAQPVYLNFYTPLFNAGFDLGAFGVALFFLISGFVISLSLEKINGIGFLVGRFFRIYPTYIIGFSITFTCIFLYAHYFGTTFGYGWSNYLAQITLFRDWLWYPSIDAISWTLEAEVKFYTLLFIISSIGKINSSKVIAGTGLFMSLVNISLHTQYAILLNTNMRLYTLVYVVTYSTVSLIFMFIGVCFYNFYQKRWNFKEFSVTVLITYVCFILAVLNNPNPTFEKMYIVTYSSALIVFSIFYILRERIF